MEAAELDACLWDALHHQAGSEELWAAIAGGTDDSGLFYVIANAFGTEAKGKTGIRSWEARAFTANHVLHIGFDACGRCLVDSDLVGRVRELTGIGIRPQALGLRR